MSLSLWWNADIHILFTCGMSQSLDRIVGFSRKIPYVCPFNTNDSRPMETNKPIQIPEEKVIEAAQAGMDEFLKVFTDAYWERIGGELTAETMPLLTGEQHVLLGYQIFRDEVLEGGFVQLIQNGYGPYIFENPFAKAMRLFGMKDFSKLIYKARKIYDAHKEDLTRDRTDEEFMAMYEQYEAFDPLEEIYIEEEETITATLAHYVDEHLELFAEIVPA